MSNNKLPFEGNSMSENLGIKFVSFKENVIHMEMPVDCRTCQPFGMLNGGASLALAEISAGIGSSMICSDNEKVVGVQISGNHISSVPVGQSVYATGTIIHKGKTTHVWNIDIKDKNEKLVSTVRVVNFIILK